MLLLPGFDGRIFAQHCVMRKYKEQPASGLAGCAYLKRSYPALWLVVLTRAPALLMKLVD